MNRPSNITRDDSMLRNQGNDIKFNNHFNHSIIDLNKINRQKMKKKKYISASLTQKIMPNSDIIMINNPNNTKYIYPIKQGSDENKKDSNQVNRKIKINIIPSMINNNNNNYHHLYPSMGNKNLEKRMMNREHRNDVNNKTINVTKIPKQNKITIVHQPRLNTIVFQTKKNCASIQKSQLNTNNIVIKTIK